MRTRGALVATVVALAACGGDSTGPSKSTVAGNYNFAITNLGANGFSCSASGMQMSLAMTHGGTFSGSHTGGIITCTGPGGSESDQFIAGPIPAPGHGADSGLAWAEGSLWVGQYRDRKIHRIDPDTGAILRTIQSNRFVTGVTWVDGELWHGTAEDDASDVRRIDAESGEVLERLEMPAGTMVSGLESDGGERFFCGGGSRGWCARCGGRGAGAASRFRSAGLLS